MQWYRWLLVSTTEAMVSPDVPTAPERRPAGTWRTASVPMLCPIAPLTVTTPVHVDCDVRRGAGGCSSDA
jgi:hypothetical protein